MHEHWSNIYVAELHYCSKHFCLCGEKSNDEIDRKISGILSRNRAIIILMTGERKTANGMLRSRNGCTLIYIYIYILIILRIYILYIIFYYVSIYYIYVILYIHLLYIIICFNNYYIYITYVQYKN